MTFELHNQAGALHLRQADWEDLLELGRRHGWQPAGTEPPRWDEPEMQAAYAQHHGHYTSVGGADALALAAALERAWQARAAEPAGPAAAAPADPRGRMARVDAQQLGEFIAFARVGKFSIHQD